MHWFALFVGVVCNALANVLIKAGVTRLGAASGTQLLQAALTEPLLYGGVVAFALALVAYALALSRLELSIAYPLMTSLGLILVAIASVRLFDESYDLRKIAGTALIIAGVAMLTWYEQAR
jgi:multidrug transporter EmrE-like cation transporter